MHRPSLLSDSFLFVATALVGGCALAACGGGGPAGIPSPGPAPTALLQGRVLSIDDSSENVAGVLFEDSRTGAVAATDDAGRFDFGEIPAGTADLWILDPSAPVPAEEIDDDRSSPLDGLGFLVELPEGETVVVEVSIRDGIIEYLGVSCSLDSEREATVPLERAETCDDPDAEGVATFTLSDTGSKFDVEVFHLAPGRSLEALVSGTTSLGLATVDADGRASWSVTEGEVMPAGVSNAFDLSGLGLEVVDAQTGLVLLVGKIADDVPPPFGTLDAGSYGSDRLLPEGDALGLAVVEVESRTDEPREVLRVLVVEAAPSASIDVLLEATPGGTLDPIGQIATDAAGSGEFSLDTADGDVLPFGAKGVADLVGREIVLRHGTTLVVLFRGRIPELTPLTW